jgi:isoquinoline 1-oxidoreductase subunit beta
MRQLSSYPRSHSRCRQNLGKGINISRLGTIARRSLLIGSAAIAGGVAFGWSAYRKPYANPLLADGDAVALTPYVLIDASGVTIITPRAEMRQGAHITLAAKVARRRHDA